MMSERIFLASPHMGGSERRYVDLAFDTNWIAPLGANVTGFEQDLQQYLGAGYVTALLAPDCGVTPGQIIAALAEHNIEARHIWKPMHLQPVFRDCAFVKTAERSVAEDVFARGVCLPSDTKMTPEQQAQVCAVIRGLF